MLSETADQAAEAEEFARLLTELSEDEKKKLLRFMLDMQRTEEGKGE